MSDSIETICSLYEAHYLHTTLKVTRAQTTAIRAHSKCHINAPGWERLSTVYVWNKTSTLHIITSYYCINEKAQWDRRNRRSMAKYSLFPKMIDMIENRYRATYDSSKNGAIEEFWKAKKPIIHNTSPQPCLRAMLNSKWICFIYRQLYNKRNTRYSPGAICLLYTKHFLKIGMRSTMSKLIPATIELVLKFQPIINFSNA